MSVNKIQALGNLVELPTEIDAEGITKERILGILREVNGDLATKLENVQVSINVQNDTIIIVRDSAVMG